MATISMLISPSAFGGWVNRTLDDASLDSFVNTLAARLASFDRETLAAAKVQVNRFGTPDSCTELQSSIDLFFPLLALPGAQSRRAKITAIWVTAFRATSN